jgi:hypothetical protein
MLCGAIWGICAFQSGHIWSFNYINGASDNAVTQQYLITISLRLKCSIVIGRRVGILEQPICFRSVPHVAALHASRRRGDPYLSPRPHPRQCKILNPSRPPCHNGRSNTQLNSTERKAQNRGNHSADRYVDELLHPCG